MFNKKKKIYMAEHYLIWKQLMCFVLIYFTKEEFNSEKFFSKFFSYQNSFFVNDIKIFSKSPSSKESFKTAIFFEFKNKRELKYNPTDWRVEFPSYLFFEENNECILPVLYLDLPTQPKTIPYNFWSVKEYQLPYFINNFELIEPPKSVTNNLNFNFQKNESNPNLIFNESELNFLQNLTQASINNESFFQLKQIFLKGLNFFANNNYTEANLLNENLNLLKINNKPSLNLVSDSANFPDLTSKNEFENSKNEFEESKNEFEESKNEFENSKNEFEESKNEFENSQINFNLYKILLNSKYAKDFPKYNSFISSLFFDSFSLEKIDMDFILYESNNNLIKTILTEIEKKRDKNIKRTLFFSFLIKHFKITVNVEKVFFKNDWDNKPVEWVFYFLPEKFKNNYKKYLKNKN